MKYLIYTRVSPKGSTFEGDTSVGMQEQICREYIARIKGEAVGVIVDDLVSGKDTNRPGFGEIFAQLDAGSAQWDTLCVYRMDRLTRSMLDQLLIFKKFVECNKGIVSATEPYFDYSTPIGRMQLAQIAAVNQYQREVNAENTRNKMISIAAGGGWAPGLVPLGYRRVERKNNVLAIDERAATAVKNIFQMYLSPCCSVKEICLKYRMNRQQVLNVLRNRVYIGKIVYAGKEFEGRHLPIIPAATFAAVQAKLPSRALRSRAKAQKYQYLLAGLVKCHCGRFMTPGSAKSGAYHYYRCTDNVNCKSVVSAPELEDKVLSQLSSLHFSESAKAQLRDEIVRRRTAAMQQRTPEVARLEKARTEIKAERDRLYEVLLSLRGQQTNFLNSKMELLSEELTVIDQQIEEHKHYKVSDADVFSKVDGIIEQLHAFARTLDDNPGNRDIQRQAIVANVRIIQQLPDKSFNVFYNYSSPNGQSWLPLFDLKELPSNLVA